MHSFKVFFVFFTADVLL